jgi:hypothetical protein
MNSIDNCCYWKWMEAFLMPGEVQERQMAVELEVPADWMRIYVGYWG